MPFLKQQVEIVNTLLRQDALADKRFEAGMYNAIAINVSRTDSTCSQICPGVMSENYEAQPTALVDDRYPIVIYHKILNKKYGLNASQFGQRNKQVNETVLVKMVVYAKYSAIKMINHLILSTRVEVHPRVHFMGGYNFLRRRELSWAGGANGLSGFSYGFRAQFEPVRRAFSRAHYQSGQAMSQASMEFSLKKPSKGWKR
jgi:hypothetical protein